MKYLATLLLFLSLSLKAAFIPLNGTPFSGSIPLLEKGSLVTSNGDNNGEFDKCPDGEFIYWDDTEENGFKCSDKLKIGPDVDSSYPYVLHNNRGTSEAQNVGFFMYMNGGDSLASTDLTSYIYQQQSDGHLYLGNNNATGNIYFKTGGNNARLTIQDDGAVTISEPGGNGGNVPHNCSRRSASGTGTIVTVDCVDGEISFFGGCYLGGSAETIYRAYVHSDLGGVDCIRTGSTNSNAYAVCCQY